MDFMCVFSGSAAHKDDLQACELPGAMLSSTIELEDYDSRSADEHLMKLRRIICPCLLSLTQQMSKQIQSLLCNFI